MTKNIFMPLLLGFFTQITYAQKNFNLTIKLDSSINPEKVRYQYYDGLSTKSIPDTFGNKRVVIIKSKFYSPSASVVVSYLDSAKGYENTFFITDKSSTISFHFKPNNKNILGYNAIENAIPVYESNINKQLTAFMTDSTFARENKAFDSFLTHNKGFGRSDSLMHVFNEFYKIRLARIMLFLKKHPDDYFCFWYFIQRVAQPFPASTLKKDKVYLKEQLAYLKGTFPAKYTTSIEGKQLIKTYEDVINSLELKLNTAAPSFNITTIDGKKISLSSLKSKYVLLDFWATWCGPCMAEIPFIKQLRKNYSSNKLVIIGISEDVDIKPLNTAIKNNAMNWLHFYDNDKGVQLLYGIEAYPTLILIDDEGKMIYKSDLKKSDKSTLPKLLTGLKPKI